MKARQKISMLRSKLLNRNIALDFDDVASLRRAEMTLHRWAEHECNGEIERNEDSNVPMRVWFDSNWKRHEYKIADRESGAFKTIRKICEANRINWFYQPDPRGCQLFISSMPLDETNYSHGVAVCDEN